MASPLFIIDLETTGLDPADAAIIEVACVAVQEGRRADEFASLVWPERRYLQARHREALAVSGITLPDLLDAPDAGEALARFHRWLGAWAGMSAQARFTSYNAEFDRSFLDGSGWGLWGNWQPCIMRACQRVMGEAGLLERRRDGEWKFPRLAAACDHFGVTMDGAHRALFDARATADLAIRLGME